MFVRTIVVLFVAVLLWAVFARDTGAGPPPRYHTVRAGDTLWSIADAKFAGDPREGVWELQRRNGLQGATIVPGQRLALP
ncbi:MAG: LysM peptidoglycan-binding domain-containing protein [Actinobacteria bacterium]|nr:LysM peptidoglycan-binding domain-containing protein [Actinomycetota bacterium]